MYAVLDDPSFRICQFSVQADHLHLICEADDASALARGIKRFKQRVARGINRMLRRKGSVFFDRYHLELLRTPRQVRACLAYVLNNGRKHGEELFNAVAGSVLLGLVFRWLARRWLARWMGAAAGGASGGSAGDVALARGLAEAWAHRADRGPRWAAPAPVSDGTGYGYGAW